MEQVTRVGCVINRFRPRTENSQAKWGLSRSILKSRNRRTLFLLLKTLSNIVMNSSYYSYVADGFR